MNLSKILALLIALAAAGAARAVEAATAAATAASPPLAAARPEAARLLERLIDIVQDRFMPAGADREFFHLIAGGALLIAAILFRHVITNVFFLWLKRLAARTKSTLDNKLLPALEPPVAALVMVIGVFAALLVLKLPPTLDRWVGDGFDVAVIVVLFWGLASAGMAVLDHFEEIAQERHMAVVTFMPLLKKTLVVLVVVFGLVAITHSFGWDVTVALSGLGIGGVAVALAGQDTLANFFGSLVVVIDQPFKVGDVVKIADNEGLVEDIGLRSTRLRTGARTQIVLPNKLVASEAIVNYTRMPQRRVEQTIGLTYDTTPDQMPAVLEDIRRILHEEPGVHQEFVAVNFVNFGESSLDIQMIYFAADPDFQKHLALRERINLKIMRAVEGRGLSFAFPTQTMHLPDPIVEKLAAPVAPRA
jgi:MscS family membrane protein